MGSFKQLVSQLQLLRLWSFKQSLDSQVHVVSELVSQSVRWFNLLKCPYRQSFLFSYLILYFMEWTSAKNLDKKRFGYECLKTWKSYFLAVDPCRWSQHRHAQSCNINSGMCDIGLMTYLACFTSVNLASWSMQNAPFQHVVWTIKLNLQR